jgi:hypothetical protein
MSDILNGKIKKRPDWEVTATVIAHAWSTPMPAYVRRSHDELLAAVLDSAVAAGRLVVRGRVLHWQGLRRLPGRRQAVELAAGLPA